MNLYFLTSFINNKKIILIQHYKYDFSKNTLQNVRKKMSLYVCNIFGRKPVETV